MRKHSKLFSTQWENHSAVLPLSKYVTFLGDKLKSDVRRNTFCKYRLQFSVARKTRASRLGWHLESRDLSPTTAWNWILPITQIAWEQILPQSLVTGGITDQLTLLFQLRAGKGNIQATPCPNFLIGRLLDNKF